MKFTTTTKAEEAVVFIHVEKQAETERVALQHARQRREEIESLIESISAVPPTVLKRGEWCQAFGAVVEVPDEDEPELVSVTARLDVKISDLDALRRFILAAQDFEDVHVVRLTWKLTPKTQEEVKYRLRCDALKELHKLGRDTDLGRDASRPKTGDYNNDDCKTTDERVCDDEDDGNALDGWDSIREFFAGGGSQVENKVGEVVSILHKEED